MQLQFLQLQDVTLLWKHNCVTGFTDPRKQKLHWCVPTIFNHLNFPSNLTGTKTLHGTDWVFLNSTPCLCVHPFFWFLHARMHVYTRRPPAPAPQQHANSKQQIHAKSNECKEEDVRRAPGPAALFACCYLNPSGKQEVERKRKLGGKRDKEKVEKKREIAWNAGINFPWRFSGDTQFTTDCWSWTLTPAVTQPKSWVGFYRWSKVPNHETPESLITSVKWIPRQGV